MKTWIVILMSGVLVALGKFASEDFKTDNKKLLVYILGSIITGTLFSSVIIWLIENQFGLMPVIVESGITAFVTIFGFLTIIRLIKNDTVAKYFEKKIEKK